MPWRVDRLPESKRTPCRCNHCGLRGAPISPGWPSPQGRRGSPKTHRSGPSPHERVCGPRQEARRSRIGHPLSTACGRFAGIAGGAGCAAPYVGSEGPDRSTHPGAAADRIGRGAQKSECAPGGRYGALKLNLGRGAHQSECRPGGPCGALRRQPASGGGCIRRRVPERVSARRADERPPRPGAAADESAAERTGASVGPEGRTERSN